MAEEQKILYDPVTGEWYGEKYAPPEVKKRALVTSEMFKLPEGFELTPEIRKRQAEAQKKEFLVEELLTRAGRGTPAKLEKVLEKEIKTMDVSQVEKILEELKTYRKDFSGLSDLNKAVLGLKPLKGEVELPELDIKKLTSQSALDSIIDSASSTIGEYLQQYQTVAQILTQKEGSISGVLLEKIKERPSRYKMLERAYSEWVEPLISERKKITDEMIGIQKQINTLKAEMEESLLNVRKKPIPLAAIRGEERAIADYYQARINSLTLQLGVKEMQYRVLAGDISTARAIAENLVQAAIYDEEREFKELTTFYQIYSDQLRELKSDYKAIINTLIREKERQFEEKREEKRRIVNLMMEMIRRGITPPSNFLNLSFNEAVNVFREAMAEPVSQDVDKWAIDILERRISLTSVPKDLRPLVSERVRELSETYRTKTDEEWRSLIRLKLIEMETQYPELTATNPATVFQMIEDSIMIDDSLTEADKKRGILILKEIAKGFGLTEEETKPITQLGKSKGFWERVKEFVGKGIKKLFTLPAKSEWFGGAVKPQEKVGPPDDPLLIR